MLDLSGLSNSFSIPLHTFVTLAFYLVLGAYVIFSAIFYYHWSTYGTDVKVTMYTLVTYFVTTIPLLIMLGSLVLVI